MKATQYRQLQLLIESFCRKAENITGKSVSVLFDGQQIEKDTFVKILPSEVIQIVADKFKLKAATILSATRMQDVAFARHCAAFYMYYYCNLPLKTVAHNLKRSDHSTIINSIKAWGALVDTNEFYKELDDAILHEINFYRNDSGKK